MPPSKNTPTKKKWESDLRSDESRNSAAPLHTKHAEFSWPSRGQKDAKHLFFCVVSARAQQEILVHSRFWVTF